ncbi:MAG: sulfite exporter TauE/SafE family protein [Chloroflexi bacterium]|nr:sulfite exporter TauE/SafE family protein [Chloroflexota bacterium]
MEKETWSKLVGLNEIIKWRTSILGFLFAVPISILGGLIGLGGAEFRLPVLAGPLGYPPRRAVPLNLAVSVVTLLASLVIRGQTLSFVPILPFLPAIFSLIAGAMVTASAGVALAGRLSEKRFENIIFILLVAIGTGLIIEGFLPGETTGFLPTMLVRGVIAGILFGLAIGLVSSLLGVAGGELIIPTLVFAFGADIKTAGTASLLVSLPTVLVGIIRYARGGAFTERRTLIEVVTPMGIGSVLGAIVGGMLVGIVPTNILKIGLGIILNISAFRIFRSMR